MTTAAQVLAQNNFGDTRTGGLAGPMGLFLIVLLATATVLLIRNMNARLRRLPDSFPDQRRDAGASPVGGKSVERTVSDTVEESSGSVPNGSHLHTDRPSGS